MTSQKPVPDRDDILANRETFLELAIRNEAISEKQVSESLSLDKQLISVCSVSAFLAVFAATRSNGTNAAQQNWQNILGSVLLFAGILFLGLAVLGALRDVFTLHKVNYLSASKIMGVVDDRVHETVLLRFAISIMDANTKNMKVQERRNSRVRRCYIFYAIGFSLTLVSFLFR